MKSDPPDAALRLMQSCLVRTHERIFYTHHQGAKLTPQVIVGKLKFRSRLAARKHFRIGSQTLNDWLANGKARFA